MLRGSGGDFRYHHGKPDLDLFAGGVIGKAGGDQADLAFIVQIRSAGDVGVVCIQVDGLLSGILVVLATVEVDDLIIGDNPAGIVRLVPV